MEDRFARLARQLDVFHPEFLLSNHGRAEDGGPVTTTRS